MRSATNRLHQGPVQAGLGHASNKSPRQEEPDPHATYPIQKPFQLQLHPLGLNNLKLEFLQQALRHNNTEFRQLSG